MRVLSFPVSVFIHILLVAEQGQGQVSETAKQLARTWAPLVWISSGEYFYPSDVDFYLASMTVRGDLEKVN